MKISTQALILAAGALMLCAAGAVAQTSPEHGPDWPDWAYGFLTPLRDGDVVAPPCPLDARPMSCRIPGTPVPDDGIKLTLPGAPAAYTRNEAWNGFGPADWYPGDHPPMPEIVAHGNQSEGVRACSLCHYANGQGKMENAHLAGLPANYILQQLAAFERGDRHSADARKVNTNEMGRMPHWMTDAEKQQAADYFSSMPFRQWVEVVEADEVPEVRASGGLMIPVDGGAKMPIGDRIIEVPAIPERMELQRDPRVGFITYVPVGSLAKGEALVTTGGGKTIQCGLCHGPDLRGLGDIPGIAGRTASYAMRQLWDIKQGTRKSAGAMEPVVQNLSAEDMRNIVAYIASLAP
jgi:cytochrome c553